MKNILKVLIVVMLFASCTKEQIEKPVQQEEIAKGKKPGGGSANSIPAPTNVRVERTGATQVKITWNSVSDATSYWIYRENAVLAIVTDTFFIDNYASTSYGYAVAAVVNSKLGTKSPYATELTSPLAQTARLSRDMFVHVGVNSATDDSWNYTGAAYTAEVKRMKMQGDYTKSNWIAIKGRGMIAGVERDVFAQLGSYSLSSNDVSYAFQVYDLKTRSQISGGDIDIHYTGNTIVLTEGMIARYEILNIGGTRWQFKINDVILFDCDLGFEAGGNFPPEIGSRNAIEVATESRGGDDFNPQIHFFSMEYFKDGSWKKVVSGRSTLSVINDPTGKANGWNVTGNGQADFYIGGSGTPTGPGTLIW